MRQLQNIDSRRNLFILDALRYSIALEQTTFESLCDLLREIETKRQISPDQNTARVSAAINHAWNLVDIEFRIKSLAAQVANLSHRTPDFQLLVRNIEGIDAFRNIYQHLDSEIPQMTGVQNPVLGAISWAESAGTSFTISIGSLAPDTHLPGLTYDAVQRRYLPHIMFSAGNRNTLLDKNHGTCEKFGIFLDQWLDSRNCLRAETLSPIIFESSMSFVSTGAKQLLSTTVDAVDNVDKSN